LTVLDGYAAQCRTGQLIGRADIEPILFGHAATILVCDTAAYAVGLSGHYRLRLRLVCRCDFGPRICQNSSSMSTPPPILTELKLSAAMKQAIDSAFGASKPIVISYVDENGAPQLSYRGSTQAYSDTQLAIWVRNPEGRILESIAKTPAVALIYGNFDPSNRGFMIFRGRAHVDGSDAVRQHVYEHSHEFERGKDPDRKGIAMLIDLDSIEGFFGGARLEMKR